MNSIKGVQIPQPPPAPPSLDPCMTNIKNQVRYKVMDIIHGNGVHIHVEFLMLDLAVDWKQVVKVFTADTCVSTFTIHDQYNLVESYFTVVFVWFACNSWKNNITVFINIKWLITLWTVHCFSKPYYQITSYRMLLWLIHVCVHGMVLICAIYYSRI